MENMKLAYIDAEMEIVAFESEDVITTSECPSNECVCESHDEEESCEGDI